jgi:hypothetical protein
MPIAIPISKEIKNNLSDSQEIMNFSTFIESKSKPIPIYKKNTQINEKKKKGLILVSIKLNLILFKNKKKP